MPPPPPPASYVYVKFGENMRVLNLMACMHLLDFLRELGTRRVRQQTGDVYAASSLLQRLSVVVQS